MTRHVLPGLLAVVAGLSYLPAHAQVSSPTGYQGRLLRADGTAATGTATVGFAVYSADSGGTALWQESQTLGLSDGYYSTFLGLVTPLPDGLFDGAVRWLEVKVGSETLAPRQRLGSVPYAATARNLTGGSANVSSLKVAGETVIDAAGRLAGAARYAAGPGIVVDAAQTVSLKSCLSGQALLHDDSSWQCAPVAGGTVTSVSASAPLSVIDGTAAAQISMTQAGASSAGYLSSADWASFNTKYGAATQCGGDLAGTLAAPTVVRLQSRPVAAAAPVHGQVLKWDAVGSQWAPSSDLNSGGTVTSVVAVAPLTAQGGSTDVELSLGAANASSDGYLSSADWVLFDAKYDAATQCGGDLAGTLQSPRVAKLQGIRMVTTAPTNSQVLRFDGSAWAPASLGIADVGGLSSGYLDLSSDQVLSGAKTFSTAPAFSTPLGVQSGGTGATSAGANAVFAGPATGSGAPGFRTLSATDVPPLDASKITTGTLGISRGGTGTSVAFAPGSVVFAGSGGAYAESASGLFWDNANGHLGVGTPTPASKLQVDGVGEFGAGGWGAGGIRVGWATNAIDANAALLLQWDSPHDVVMARGGGRVGVGTTNPLNALDVGFGNSDVLVGPMQGPSTTRNLVRLGYEETGDYAFLNAVTPGTAERNLVLNQYGGSVGIGTTSPTAKLEVQGGDLKVSGRLRSSGALLSADDSGGPTCTEAGALRWNGSHFQGCTGTYWANLDNVPPPGVNSVTPTSGPAAGGTSVTIVGSNFQALARVFFGTVESPSVSVPSATQLVAVTPAGSGTVDVKVMNLDYLSGTLAAAYTFVPAPTITGLNPPSGSPWGGATAAIAGTSFQSGTTVKFGSTTASRTFVDSGHINAVVPPGSAGTVTVTVTNPDGQTGTWNYTYNRYGGGTDGSVTVSATKNMNTDNLGASSDANGGSADGVAYKVSANPTGTTITVAGTVTNAFAPGDVVLLVGMQGTSSDSSAVGTYELLGVAGVSGSTITTTSAIQNSYQGTSFANQKVVVQRVPQYSNVTVSGGAITAGAWDGLAGASGSNPVNTGIVAFFANGTLTLGGSGIDVSQKGFRGGTTGSGAGPEQYDGSVTAGGADGENGCDFSVCWLGGRGGNSAGGLGGGGSGNARAAGSTGGAGQGGGGGATNAQYDSASQNRAGGAGGGPNGGGGGGGSPDFESNANSDAAGGGGGASYDSGSNPAPANVARLYCGGGGSQGAGGGGGMAAATQTHYYGRGGKRDGTAGPGGDASGNGLAGTAGAAGGGVVFVEAATASLTGLVQANGGNGGAAGAGGTTGWEGGFGGGGEGGEGASGGTIHLAFDALTIGTDRLLARGGNGGAGGAGGGGTCSGGSGGAGATFAAGLDNGSGGGGGGTSAYRACGGGGSGGRSGRYGKVYLKYTSITGGANTGSDPDPYVP